MKFKLVIFAFYFIFYGYVNVSAVNLTNDIHVYNMDVGNNFIVYEYKKIVDEKELHYIGLFNRNTNEFIDIKNNKNEIIKGDMLFPSISDNDLYLTFTSRAENITNDAINMCFNIITSEYQKCSNIYIYDINKKESFLLKNGNEHLNGDSYISKISGDGNSVVFESSATNNLNFSHIDKCLRGVENICVNIYKHNILTRTTTLVSSSNDNQGGNFSSISPSISYDGRFITFQSISDNLLVDDFYNDSCKNVGEDDISYCSHIYLFDSYSNKLKLISKISKSKFNDNSGNAKISSNGNVIVYESYATNIESKFNNKQHVVLYDLQKDKNIIISKNGSSLNNRDSYFVDISNDGRYLLLKSNSTNLDEAGGDRIYIYNTNNMKFDLFKENIEVALINNSYIYSYSNLISEYNVIDSSPPVIEKNQTIYVLKDSNVLLRDKVVVNDNLTKEIDVFLEDNLILNKVGEHDVIVSALDMFFNCSKEKVKIVVLEEDRNAPVFNELSEIKILKGSSTLNLSNYINAIDDIDGNTKIYIIDDGGLNLNVRGEYKVKVMSKDSSNNKVYKEIEIIVYENYSFDYIYEILLILGIVGVIIFSIIKVK